MSDGAMPGDAAYAHCTDRQLVMEVLNKYPNLVEHTQSFEDEHTPNSVMQEAWNALHDALSQSEVEMRAQLLLRATEARPYYNEQSVGSLAASHVADALACTDDTAAAHEAFANHTANGNGFSGKEPASNAKGTHFSGKEPASDSEGSEELQDIYDAVWPCESSQYKRKLGDLRVAVSLAARQPDPAREAAHAYIELRRSEEALESCIIGSREQATTPHQELEQQPTVRMPSAHYPVPLPPPSPLPPSPPSTQPPEKAQGPLHRYFRWRRRW